MPNQVQIQSTIPLSLQLTFIYILGDSYIVTTIIYFLSLASDRQSLDFYRSPIASQSTRSYHTIIICIDANAGMPQSIKRQQQFLKYECTNQANKLTPLTNILAKHLLH